MIHVNFMYDFNRMHNVCVYIRHQRLDDVLYSYAYAVLWCTILFIILTLHVLWPHMTCTCIEIPEHSTSQIKFELPGVQGFELKLPEAK